MDSLRAGTLKDDSGLALEKALKAELEAVLARHGAAGRSQGRPSS